MTRLVLFLIFTAVILGVFSPGAAIAAERSACARWTHESSPDETSPESEFPELAEFPELRTRLLSQPASLQKWKESTSIGKMLDWQRKKLINLSVQFEKAPKRFDRWLEGFDLLTRDEKVILAELGNYPDLFPFSENETLEIARRLKVETSDRRTAIYAELAGYRAWVPPKGVQALDLENLLLAQDEKRSLLAPLFKIFPQIELLEKLLQDQGVKVSRDAPGAFGMVLVVEPLQEGGLWNRYAFDLQRYHGIQSLRIAPSIWTSANGEFIAKNKAVYLSLNDLAEDTAQGTFFHEVSHGLYEHYRFLQYNEQRSVFRLTPTIRSKKAYLEATESLDARLRAAGAAESVFVRRQKKLLQAGFYSPASDPFHFSIRALKSGERIWPGLESSQLKGGYGTNRLNEELIGAVKNLNVILSPLSIHGKSQPQFFTSERLDSIREYLDRLEALAAQTRLVAEAILQPGAEVKVLRDFDSRFGNPVFLLQLKNPEGAWIELEMPMLTSEEGKLHRVFPEKMVFLQDLNAEKKEFFVGQISRMNSVSMAIEKRAGEARSWIQKNRTRIMDARAMAKKVSAADVGAFLRLAKQPGNTVVRARRLYREGDLTNFTAGLSQPISTERSMTPRPTGFKNRPPARVLPQ